MLQLISDTDNENLAQKIAGSTFQRRWSTVCCFCSGSEGFTSQSPNQTPLTQRREWNQQANPQPVQTKAWPTTSFGSTGRGYTPVPHPHKPTYVRYTSVDLLGLHCFSTSVFQQSLYFQVTGRATGASRQTRFYHSNSRLQAGWIFKCQWIQSGPD